MGVLLLVIAVLLAWLSTRFPLQADWTQAGRYTLSEASAEVLKRVEGPLEITAYARDQTDLRDAIKKLIYKYQRVKPDIVLRFVNPDAVPDEVRNLGIDVNGELVFRYQDRRENVRKASESEIVNAIQRLLRASDRWLAFIEGHGERNPLGKANHDLGEWGQTLHQRGFLFQSINLADQGAIPDNTTVLVIASPLVDLLPGETEIILDYLQHGGNLLWLTDPGEESGLDALAAYLHVTIGKGTVIDFSGQLVGVSDPTMAMVTASLYGPHPALDDFSYTSLFPKTTSVTANSDNPWTVKPLLTTGDHTWLETGALAGEVKLDGADTQGPLTIGLSLERDVSGKQQRIIIVGDGDFLSNTYIGNTGNLELGLRFANWLSSDDDLISIPARTAGDTQLTMSTLLLGTLGILFLVLLPLGLAAAGIFIWWRRKKL